MVKEEQFKETVMEEITAGNVKFRFSPILFLRSGVKMIWVKVLQVIKVRVSDTMNGIGKKGLLKLFKFNLRGIL